MKKKIEWFLEREFVHIKIIKLNVFLHKIKKRTKKQLETILEPKSLK